MESAFRYLSLIAALFWSMHLCAQEQEKTEVSPMGKLEDKIEQLSEETEADIDYSEMVDDLLQYIAHPINLNKATEGELRQLQLNDLQIHNLVSYINKYGELTSIYELGMVEGYDSTLITALSPFITFQLEPVGAKINLRNLSRYGRHQIITRYQRVLQEQKGFSPISDSALALKPNSRYLGGPERLYLRYGYSFYNKVRFGVTMEKDPGEVFLNGPDSIPRGFDFYSAYFYYIGDKFVKNLAIGDYHLAFGQGLAMYSSLAFSKSAGAITNRRIAQQVKPNTGVNENLFMRGAAATITPFKSTDLTVFYSDKKVDASISGDDLSSADDLFISSLQETGYHRTPNELAKKNAIQQTVYGGNIQTRIKMFRVGATAYRTVLGADLKRAETLYNRFDFRGKELTNYGVDFAAILRSITVFGEAAGSNNGGKAMLLGATATPDARLAVSIIYRNYGKDYQSFFSNAFGEGSRNANEKGLYVGMFTQLFRRWSLSAYADHFRFGWLRYRVDAPSRGNDYLAQITWDPNRRTEIQMRYRYRQKELNPSGMAGYTYFPEPETRQNARVHFSFKPTNALTLKSRIEHTWWFRPGLKSRTGFLIYQDVAFKLPEKPWAVNARYALFDTDTYNERLYAYENDVLYAFSIPSYYYKGNRFYLMGKYSFGRRLDIWVRYAITQYANRSVISSGLDEIDGNTKSEVKVQLRVKF